MISKRGRRAFPETEKEKERETERERERERGEAVDQGTSEDIL